MGLEDGFDLLSGDLTAIINRLEGLREGFATLRTFEALMPFAGSFVLVSFRVVAVGTLHHASPDSLDANDESHVWLVHDRIGVILINHGQKGFKVDVGMKIAQMVIQPVVRVNVEASPELDIAARGDKGFGSTGLQ
jgi:hypothetical protein